jgi:hypothetical protein
MEVYKEMILQKVRVANMSEEAVAKARVPLYGICSDFQSLHMLTDRCSGIVISNHAADLNCQYGVCQLCCGCLMQQVSTEHAIAYGRQLVLEKVSV